VSNPYPGGQCTWGAAEMFPCLQNLAQYGNFGNGGDWFNHAQSLGLETSTNPQQGWLASFRTGGWPSGTGDVGLIVSVNNDGTVTRYGTNWHMDGQWSTDRVSQSLVIGSFKPPCVGTGTVASGIASASNVLMSTNQPCRTFAWNFPLGVTLCFDTLLAMAAVGGGSLVILAGLIVIIVGATGKNPIAVPMQAPAQTPQTPPQQSRAPFDPEAVRLRAQQRAAARQQARPVAARASSSRITPQSVAAKVRAGKTLTAAETAYGNANQEAVGRALASMAPAGG
jgi:surface antigen